MSNQVQKGTLVRTKDNKLRIRKGRPKPSDIRIIKNVTRTGNGPWK